MELSLVAASGQAAPLFHARGAKPPEQQVSISRSDELRADPQTGTKHEPSNNFPVQAPAQNIPAGSVSVGVGVQRGRRSVVQGRYCCCDQYVISQQGSCLFNLFTFLPDVLCVYEDFSLLLLLLS